MLRFALALLLLVLTLALFVRLLTDYRPFRLAVLILVATAGASLWWLSGHRHDHSQIMLPVPAGNGAAPTQGAGR